MTPFQELSWGWVPPFISGSRVIGSVDKSQSEGQDQEPKVKHPYSSLGVRRLPGES